MPKISLPKIKRPEIKKPELRRKTSGVYYYYDYWDKNDYGFVGVSTRNRIIYIWPDKKCEESPWLQLAPLVFSNKIKVKEIHLRGEKFQAKLLDGWYSLYFVKNQLNVQRLQLSIAIATGSKFSIKYPVCECDLDGWRISMALSEVSLEPEFSAVKIQQVPDLLEITKSTEKAAFLVLASITPGALLIFGESNTGKTTLLNSILLTVHKMFPQLRIVVVEKRAELQLPSSPLISRRRGENLTQLIRDAYQLLRPHILVLGELRGGEIVSWIECASAGTPSLSTIHAPDYSILWAKIFSFIKMGGAEIRKEDIPLLFKVLVQTERKIDAYGREIYGVREIYISTGEEYVPLSSIKEALELLPEPILEESKEEIYRKILNSL